MKYRNHSVTNVGKVRSANEDNYGDALTPNGHLFVVCDGMGGHVGGAKASAIAVQSIIEYFQREQYGNLIQAIDRAFTFANEQIFANALSEPDLKGMGTTAVVLIISGNDCYIGHVGDSRIYLKSNNKLHRITKDHSFVQTLVDSGVISDEEAESHPNKNQILKALGTSSVVEGTICQNPIEVKAGDVFLLCSDGLNGMVNDQGLEMMLQGEDLHKSGDDLIRAALDAGGNDNVTLTIVAIDESAYMQSKFVDYNPVKRFDGSSTQTFAPVQPPATGLGSFFSSAKGIAIIGACVLLIGVLGYLLIFSGNSEVMKTSNTETSNTTSNSQTEVSQVDDQNEEEEIKDIQQPVPVQKKEEGKVDDNNKKEKDVKTELEWPKKHKVKAGESLNSISSDYNNKYSLKLNSEILIKYNKENNTKLTPNQKGQLDEEKIDAGVVLLIPKQ